MSDQPVLFSRAAASCRLTLNREDKCHAINEEMIESLDHYLNEIENDHSITDEDKNTIVKEVLNGRWFSSRLDSYFNN